MTEYHIKRVVEILNQIVYITIATSSEDNQPWNSPVFTVFDENLTFYWGSDTTSQHSKNIAQNEKVFLVIYDSTMPEGTGEGVYIQAIAKQFPDETVSITRLSDQKKIEFKKNNILSIYQASPVKIWMNDVENDEQGNYIRDIRVEIPVEKVIEKL